MPKFIHSVLSQNASITAGTTVTIDLPVNPLSVIYVTIKFQQDQANTQMAFLAIMAMISKIEVLFKGSAVYTSSGLDLFAVGRFVTGFESWGVNADGNDDDERSFTFMLPLTRFPYSPTEAFPRSTRGELQLQITYAASFSQIDSAEQQIETLELPDATPRQYMKTTTLSVTPTATGEFDIELPIGNRISELVMFGTTSPTGATATKTLNYAQLLVDNQRVFYSQINYETLISMAGLRLPAPGYWATHVHRLTAAAFAQYDDTSAVIASDHPLLDHVWLPFDVLRDGQYILETAGKSDIVIRLNAGDTNPVRVLPIEIVSV